MNLLLDTHVAIWALTAIRKISPAAREAIVNPDNTVHVSAVSIWEIAIRHALGKEPPLPFSSAEAISFFSEAGYNLLNVTPAHAAAVERLPPLHRDPFDRLLIAQAISEPLQLLSHDAQVAAYGSGIWRV